MANHPSALKRERQAQKRRRRNRAAISVIKTAVKKLTAAVSGPPDEVKAAFTAAVSTLDRAAGKGIIPKKRAARKVSRLARQVNKITAAAPPPTTP